MDITRRGQSVAGCSAALVAGGLLFTAPLLLYAAAAVACVLLGTGLAFVRRFGATLDATSVDVELDPDDPLVDERTTLTLRAERADTRLPMRVVLSLPESAAGSDRVAFELDSHETVRVSRPVTWSVAGTYRLGPARVTATDPLGLFVAAVEWDERQTVHVEARQPETVHLGHGGSRVAAAFGEHRASQSSTGIEPAKLQRYQPGSQINRIDWKATARLDDVFVVDPETQTHRQTVLLLDHRATTDVGEGTETALAYLRHAALAIVGSARDLDDPVGLYAVGDRGVTVAEPPDVGPGQYAAIEDVIRDLESSRPVGRRWSQSDPTADPSNPNRAAQASSAADSTAAGGTSPAHGASTADQQPVTDPNGRATQTATAPQSGTANAAATARETATAGEAGSADPTAQASEPESASAEPAATESASAEPASAEPAATESAAAGSAATEPASTQSDQAAWRTPSIASAPSPFDRRTALGAVARDASFDARAASRLSDGGGEFARSLRPYFEDPTQYLHRVQDDPLFAAARTYLERIRGSLWTVILTDDSRRGELRETVKVARSNDDRVLVVMTPRVLFEPGGLADVDRAYSRYRDFESFRRDLASMNRVDALELAPGDRIEAVLSAGGTDR